MAHFSNGLEHRWGERVRVNIPVRVSAAALARVGGSLTNLSLSGAFMKSDCELRLHALIEVRIELPPPASRTVAVEAYVSRIHNEGVGIEWCEFGPHVIKELLRDPSVSSPPTRMSGANLRSLLSASVPDTSSGAPEPANRWT
jgi:hypothetical protein